MHVWIVSEAKAGTLTQCLGVARLLSPEPRRVIVQKDLPRWRAGVLSPYRRLAEPRPDLVISCGGKANSHVAALAAVCREKPFTVHLATPKPVFVPDYDVAFISRHDWDDEKESEPRFHKMLGVPHEIATADLLQRRQAARARFGVGSGKVASVLTGGSNRAYHYDDATTDRLLGTIRDLAAAGWKVLVSTSRRSRPELLARLLPMAGESIYVWNREGDNPYRDFLAAADALIVTKDSITMCCEALATGKPVYVFDLVGKPGAQHDKFERFHRDMSETLKLTRPFAGDLAPYGYEPPAEAQRIAEMIRKQIEFERPALARAGWNPRAQGPEPPVSSSP